MDRFVWSDGLLAPDEQLVFQQSGVKLYDGEEKTPFEYGKLVLTTHRLIWKHHKDQKCIISLHLSYVIFTEEQPSPGFYKSPKMILHLSPTPKYRPPGPVAESFKSYIKLAFKDGGQTETCRCLAEELAAKRWITAAVPGSPAGPAATSAAGSVKKAHAGIVGIERHLQQKAKATDKGITEAFQDLTKLMDKAKEMVFLSKNISAKIKDKQGNITEDETIRFKSYLLSLGISDPVTRETHGSGNKYFRELAKQVSTSLEQPLTECGGMMTVTDVYCRVNRARGMELLSPEDLINACKLMEELRLPVRLRVFESGVMVLQLLSHNEDKVIQETSQIVEKHSSLTADELSKLVGISVILSKERLLLAENQGSVCRDETVEGLRFFKNRLLLEV